MKKINITKMIMDNELYYTERLEVLGMEFIKLNDGNYMIKNSNGYIVSEKEKLQLEKKELVIKDIESNKCQEDTTKKISKINRKLRKEIKPIEEPIEETPVEDVIKDEDIEETKPTEE